MSADSWSRYGPMIVAAAVALALGIVGGLVTDIGPWYRNLKKPSWQPPDWLFGPVWTVIFILAAIAGVLAWNAATSDSARAGVIGAFALNCALNVLWSWLFFRSHRPDWALIELVALWASIVALLVVTIPLDSRCGWLLSPYLAWVTFAGILNATVSKLNAPFA